MEANFNGREQLAADHGTIADISCFGSISILPDYVYERVNLDNLTAWPGSLRALLGAIDPEGYPL